MAYVASGYWTPGYAVGDTGAVSPNPYGLHADVNSLAPGGIISFYEFDLSTIPGGPDQQFYFCPSGPNLVGTNVVWQGITYTSFPVEVTGIELNNKGPIPRPTLRVSNITGNISFLLLNYQDLIGARITRKRTLTKYLDAVNFVGGVNASADPSAELPTDVYFVRRKVKESKLGVEIELGSSMDVQGVVIPLRQVIANVCTWKYRSPECSYAGAPVAKFDDTATSNPSEDVCGKRLSSCKLRFGSNGQLPYGGMPTATLNSR